MSRVLYRGAALAQGSSRGSTVTCRPLVTDGSIRWIRPSEEPGHGVIAIDASGATIWPAPGDCHSHLTGAGGARWLERFSDPPEARRAGGRPHP